MFSKDTVKIRSLARLLDGHETDWYKGLRPYINKKIALKKGIVSDKDYLHWNCSWFFESFLSHSVQQPV
jgi:hypothetical protein